VMFKFTHIIMYYAPIGVGAAMAYTVGHLGMTVLLPLGKLVLTAYAALAAFLLLVLLPIVFLARLPFVRFLRAIAEPATIAFATSASEAALPRAMESMEAFGVPRQIVAFVIPAGYSFNMDGGSVYLAVASIFVAQAAGIPMTWSAQLLMVLTLMLTSKGHCRLPEPANRTHLRHHGCRCSHRHGPHRGKRDRQLPGVRRHRPLGRPAWG
jgi:proton glutamate symport protein